MARGQLQDPGGSVVFNRLWASVHNRVVSAQVEAARRRAGSIGEQPPVGGLGTKLTGELIRLDRMAAVWPDTVVIVFHGDAAPELRYPGDVVVPPMFPGRTPTYVLPVATGTVTVDVEITNAATYDGYRIEQVVIRVSLHLSPADRYGVVAALAAQFHTNRTNMEEFLLRQVKVEVANEVEAAIRLNRLADLRHTGLQAVLADRWLPRTFAGGALVRESFEVRSIIWPDVDIEQAELPRAAGSGLHLTLDARLHRVWQRHAESDLLGIAGAQAGGGSTVIAVPAFEPLQYEIERLREEYARLYGDQSLALLTITADDYQELVRKWFELVDTYPGRLIRIDSNGEEKPLRINIGQPTPPEGGRPADPGGNVGTESARLALLQLLHHPQVDFV